MKHRQSLFLSFTIGLFACSPATAQIDRVWLTHRSPDPRRLVINWETAAPGNSVVRFGPTTAQEHAVSRDESVTQHHVEIPLDLRGVTYHYSVQTGEFRRDATFKAYPAQELRLAVIADWGYANPDLAALRRDDPHLLLTAGDNVPSLHPLCGPGVKDCTAPFRNLIDAAPELFRSTPFLPILGNHDREIRPRGSQPPPEPVYDIDATAFCRFFELPGDEWKWAFTLPDFDLRVIALDLNHTSDFGTTWQTCHDFHRNSDQFNWYRRLMTAGTSAFTITLHNENNQRMRACEDGGWARLFQMGTAVISGFGYYAERAEVDGFPYFNTALSAGTQYPDSDSKVCEAGGGFILITLKKGGPLTVELKMLDGRVLDRTTLPGRRP